jgi:hypothetical protein
VAGDAAAAGVRMSMPGPAEIVHQEALAIEAADPKAPKIVIHSAALDAGARRLQEYLLSSGLLTDRRTYDEISDREKEFYREVVRSINEAQANPQDVD